MPVETEYSLCVLLESAVQMMEFTTDVKQFLQQVPGETRALANPKKSELAIRLSGPVMSPSKPLHADLRRLTCTCWTGLRSGGHGQLHGF